MPPKLATICCVLYILYLFWADCKKSDGPSKALWIPFFWMFLAGSRYVSTWAQLSSGSLDLADTYNDGNTVDATVFMLLIVAGIFILYRRKINWTLLLSQNKCLWLYFLYCGISFAWSDFPIISLKRIFKDMGNPIMAMVILTERSPYDTVGIALRRLAFVMIPLSVLFIRFYPDLGRAYSYGGETMYTGVTNHKNFLGQLCLFSTIYYSWIFFLKRKADIKFGEMSNVTDFLQIGMTVYLLYLAHSATSTACSVVAVCLFMISSTKLIAQKPGRILNFMVVAASLYFVMDATMDVKDAIIESLGRDKDLTTRVPVWHELIELSKNPLVGAGYMSFWAGDNLKMVWATIGSTILQAHSGYVEQYLNLGYVGVGFIGLIILFGLLKVRRHLEVDYPSAMLRLCFIITAVLYNYTEATFYGISNMWILLLIGVIEIPKSGAFQ